MAGRKYTIKSTSNEGIYYLVSGWYKHKKIWISEAKVFEDIQKAKDMFFTSESYAKANLTKLLKVMGEEYGDDSFEVVEFA